VLTVLKILAGVTTVLALAGGVGWGLYRFAVTSPHFGLARITVEGSARRSDATIIERAGLRLGQNVFRIDLAAAERRLLEDPWIRTIRLRRELPDGLRIELSEREAQAIAVIGERLYLVTPEGLPFKELGSEDPDDRPFVTGVSEANMARDPARERDRIAKALEMLRQYERLPTSRVHPPQEVHITRPGQLVLTVGRSGITLYLGRGPWRKRLLMAAKVIAQARRHGRVPGIVFLDNEAHPERVVARMR
jgi:cell division protein FtsQ